MLVESGNVTTLHYDSYINLNLHVSRPVNRKLLGTRAYFQRLAVQGVYTHVHATVRACIKRVKSSWEAGRLVQCGKIIVQLIVPTHVTFRSPFAYPRYNGLADLRHCRVCSCLTTLLHIEDE